jgi:GGDEF domain-containing protein
VTTVNECGHTQISRSRRSASTSAKVRRLEIRHTAVASVLGDTGQAFRLGGDEVLIVLPAQDASAASREIETIAHLLAASEPHKSVMQLSIAAGIVCILDPRLPPSDIRHRADLGTETCKALESLADASTKRHRDTGNRRNENIP